MSLDESGVLLDELTKWTVGVGESAAAGGAVPASASCGVSGTTDSSLERGGGKAGVWGEKRSGPLGSCETQGGGVSSTQLAVE